MILETLDELWLGPATVSPNVASAMYSEILWHRPTWRCYTSATLADRDLEHLMLRYVRAHATQPGILSDETLAGAPVAVGSFTHGGAEITGAVFLNGACYLIRYRNEDRLVRCFFVEERVAALWGYPEGYTFTGPEVRAHTAKERASHDEDGVGDPGPDSMPDVP